MRKKIEHDLSIFVFIFIAKPLIMNEDRHRMTSENFFYKYSKGQLDDSADFIEWVNGYQH
jgi:hypothetical protein